MVGGGRGRKREGRLQEEIKSQSCVTVYFTISQGSTYNIAKCFRRQ